MYTPVIIFLIIFAILAFELWMFIDALRNPHLDTMVRAVWLVGIVLVPLIAAVAYFFLGRPGASTPIDVVGHQSEPTADNEMPK